MEVEREKKEQFQQLLRTKLPKDETQWKRNGIDLKQSLQKQQKRYVAKNVEGEGTRKHPGGQTIKEAVRRKNNA
jgi:hypothetical protein